MNNWASMMIFNMHFDEVLDVKHTGTWSEGGDVRQRALLRFDTADIESLRCAYDSIAALAPSFDYVCGFACGALPLIIHIAHSECRRLFGRDWPKCDEQLSELQGRLHVFPGLSWTMTSSSVFVEFLHSHGPNERMLLIDCSFSGGALGKIAKVVSDYSSNPTSIAISGIVDKGRLEEQKIVNCRNLFARGVIQAFKMFPVRNLISEDFSNLLGFSSLHKKEGLAPLWAPGAIAVRDVATGRFLVQASEPLHTVFTQIMNLKSYSHDKFCIDKEDVDQRSAETLFMVLKNRLQREYQQMITDVGSSDASTLLKQKQILCGQWKSETSALKRAFAIEAELPVPEFCSTLAEEKRILSGDTVALEIFENGDGLSVVNIRCRYHDISNAVQTDFSFLLPEEHLQQALNQHTPLTSIIPPFYRSKFDALWQQLDKDVKRVIETKWLEFQEALT